jgi:hypothetical protein
MLGNDLVSLADAAREKGYKPRGLMRTLVDRNLSGDIYIARSVLSDIPMASRPGRRGPSKERVDAFRTSMASAGINLSDEEADKAYRAWLASRKARQNANQ